MSTDTPPRLSIGLLGSAFMGRAHSRALAFDNAASNALGWGDSFVHELRHFLGAAAGAWGVAPHGATFHDGYRCAQVCDAVLAAAERGVRQEIEAPAEATR